MFRVQCVSSWQLHHTGAAMSLPLFVSTGNKGIYSEGGELNLWLRVLLCSVRVFVVGISEILRFVRVACCSSYLWCTRARAHNILYGKSSTRFSFSKASIQECMTFKFNPTTKPEHPDSIGYVCSVFFCQALQSRRGWVPSDFTSTPQQDAGVAGG